MTDRFNIFKGPQPEWPCLPAPSHKERNMARATKATANLGMMPMPKGKHTAKEMKAMAGKMTKPAGAGKGKSKKGQY